MKRTWFHHNDLTTQEADELTLQYQRRNIQTRKQLNPDRLSWCVSAYLEETKTAPRPSIEWQSAMWRAI